MNPHPVCRSRYTIYRWHQSHSLCHQSNCIENVTLTLCMTSHSPYVWHRLHYTRLHILTLWPLTIVFWHHTHYIWHCVHCICAITSTVLMISHQMYLWDHIHYNSWHHIFCIRHVSHCICAITATCLMISQLCMYDIKPTIGISYSLYKASHSHFMISHHIMYDITCTVFMKSLPLYLTLHPRYLCQQEQCIN